MAWKIVETDYENKNFWQEKADYENRVEMMRVINVYPECRYQKIRGFGGAFTESSGYNLTRLPEAAQEEVIKAYFGQEGLRYNLGRTHINSCDFALGNYAYDEDEADAAFEKFDIGRDKKYILPMIVRAKDAAGEEIELLASPWSPPAYMKTNGEMNHGGKLKEEYRARWAEIL